MRPALAAGLLALAAAAAHAPVAGATGVELTTAFAAPIAAGNELCNAEPRAYVDGTKNYDASKPLKFTSSGVPGYGFWMPPNIPSYLDLAPSSDAGSRPDLCAGVSFTPDVEPAMLRDLDHLDAPRVPDAPAWPDVADTHVVPTDSGQPAPVGDDARTVTIALPAGYGAQLGGITPCTDAQFGVGSYADAACPAASQVGEAFARISGYTTALFHSPVSAVKLYALGHGPNELARLGLSAKPAGTLAPVKVVARLLFAADGSGRLALQIAGAPRATYDASAIATAGSTWNAEGLADGDPRIGQPLPGSTVRQLYVESLSVRLWGNTADHPALAANVGTLGSACGTTVGGDATATTYGANASALAAPTFTVGGCSALALPATTAVTTTQHAPATPTGVTTSIDLPQPAGTLAPALVASARIGLPAGLDPGAQVASGSGFTLCTPAQFGAASRAAGTCSKGSQVGTAELSTTVSDVPLTGAISLGVPPSSDPAGDATVAGDHTIAAVLVDAGTPGASTADAPRVKLSGRLVGAADGTTAIVFDALPAIRITHLGLTFTAGSAALFTTPDTCGDHAGTTHLRSGGIGPEVSSSTSLSISGPCDATAAGALALSSTTPAAGGADATGITITRGDTSAPLTGFSVDLPAGILVSQTATVPCDASAAATAGCTDASRLGEARLLSGPTGEPLTGSIFRTAAPDIAAAAGAVLILDPGPGGLGLGRTVVPIRFDLRSGDAGLTATASLPRSAGGLRLDLRSLELDLDRPGAVSTPTACGPLTASARISTAAGAVGAQASAAYASCAAHGFAPDFASRVTADGAGRAQLSALLTGNTGDASLRSATLTLPPGVAIDPAAARRACSIDQFSTGICPDTARAGSVAAQLGIAPDAIAGDLDLVAVPGQAQPGLGITFSGPYGHRALGQLTVAASGRVTARFADLADLPLSRFAIVLDGGASSVLTQSAAGCGSGPAWIADLVGQNGGAVTRSGGALTACAVSKPGSTPAPVKLKTKLEFSMSAKTGLKLKLNGFGGRQLKSAKLTLPASLRFDTKAVKKKRNIAVVVLGAKVKNSFSGGSLLMSFSGGPAQEAVARVRPGAYFKRGAVKGKLQKFPVRLVFTDGSTEARVASAKLP